MIKPKIQAVDSSLTEKKKSPKEKKYFIRPGYDIGKKIWASTRGGKLDEFSVDAGYKRYRLDLIYGLEQNPLDFKKYRFDVQGSYWKAGISYNAYENWPGTDNDITIGLRYAQAKYFYHIRQAVIYPYGAQGEPVIWELNETTRKLQARWIEVISSVKTEIFRGLYLELRIAGKYLLKADEPTHFESVYIPGFFKTNISKFVFGMGYGISYKIKF